MDLPDPSHRTLIADQLRAVHALKAASLRMFDPMLATVERERQTPEMRQVRDLLSNMLNAFGGHRTETAEHERLLRARLEQLDERPLGRLRRAAARRAAALRARFGSNHGANARDAYVYEQLEIALLELLERTAARGGDRETARLARACLADDRAMADKITRNWDNVVSLTLASKRIAFERPEPEAAPRQPIAA